MNSLFFISRSNGKYLIFLLNCNTHCYMEKLLVWHSDIYNYISFKENVASQHDKKINLY